MRLHRLLPLCAFAPALLLGQGRGVPPSELLKPLKDDWPTYNGDYTGRRFSALDAVNKANVKHLSLAWMTRLTAGAGRSGRGGGPAVPLQTGGEGTGDIQVGGGSIKCSVLAVD